MSDGKVIAPITCSKRGPWVRTHVYDRIVAMETAITAGGTTIAVDNAQTGYLIWKASDPVTGSTATFTHNGSGASRHVKEYEPLGQQVAILDPADLPDPPANESVSHWMDMEWQCTEVPQEFWDSAGSMPFHCQFKNELRAASSTSGIISIYDKDKKDGDATYIHAGAEYEEEDDIGSTLTHESLHSTTKFMSVSNDTGVVEKSSEPDDCDGEVDLEKNIVDIRCGYSFDPKDTIDVRESDLGEGRTPRRPEHPDRWLEKPNVPDSEDSKVYCDSNVIEAMKKAWRQSGLGRRNTEAGFLVFLQKDGSLRIQHLPQSNQYGSLTVRFTPNANEGLVALFHTHPNRLSRYPSATKPRDGDKRTAKNLKTEVFVIHERGLSSIDQNGVVRKSIRQGYDWKKECENDEKFKNDE